MTDRVIRVILDPSGVQRGGRQVDSTLRGVEQSSRRTSAGLRAAAAAATALVGALSARELIRTADTFNRIENRLRIVTDTTEELNTANTRLLEIAQNTRQPLEATVELFTRASIAADELGASEEELFRLTEITGQALAVQGGAASEAAGALRQLSQSFASGIVRAEEFNSILEGAFPLAQAAARGIDEAGGSVGRLRQLVVEGEISSREFFEAILEGGEALGDQFGQTVPTVSQAMTVLNNTFIQFVGELDSAIGASDALASGIISLAEGMSLFGRAIVGTLDPTDELSVGLERIAIGGVLVGETFSQLFSLVGTVSAAFTDFGQNLGGIAAAIVQTLSGNFGGAADILRDLSFDDTQAALTDFFESVDEGATTASERISQILIPSFREARQAAEEIAPDNRPAFVDNEDIEAAEKLAEEMEKARQAAIDLNQSFEDQILELREEIELLGADNAALAENAELRALIAGATADQAAEIGLLTEQLLDERDALQEEAARLEGFFQEVGASAQRTLSGFLADPLSDGLDELPGKFAQTLQQLAADALSSEIFTLLGGALGGAGAAGGGGGFLGLLGGLFGEGRAAGGPVSPGRAFMVGERGPEIFSPPSSGMITPNVNVQAAAQAPPVVNVTNVTDPADIPAGLRTPEASEEVINIIQRNPDAVRRILG